MDLEMWLILGAVIVFVFVASFLKSGKPSGDSSYDRHIASEAGIEASGYSYDTGSSGDSSDSCEASDSSDSGCDCSGGSDD